MADLVAFIAGEETILLDGAMGTQLIDQGLSPGTAPEEWNLTNAEAIVAVHKAYIEAGSQIILTNSFGGSSSRLAMHDLGDRVVELNQAAARVGRMAADTASHAVFVAGSIGPTGRMLEPLGDLSPQDARQAFAEQAEALAQGGADLLWIETMSDLEEAKAAIEAARSACNLPIAATLTFDTHGRTMMGISPQQAAQELEHYDLIAFGANCGNGPAEIESVIAAMHEAAPGRRLIAKSNAGVPRERDGQIVYDGSPEVMAEHAVRVRSLGARLIGACCGSTPAHIRAMARALGKAKA